MIKPRLYTIHGGWGNHIEWMDWDRRKVWGHLPRRPEVGDWLKAPLERGIAYFKFTDVELMSDPHDMFFATVEDVGYEKDVTPPDFQELSQEERIREAFPLAFDH